MTLVLILLCFYMILQPSVSPSNLTSKPKPVDLEFSCTAVDITEQEFKEDIPVILLHGLSGNKETWNGISEAISLDTKRKVYAVDLRNHGRSPWNNEEYGVVAMTEDIKHFMDRINASKATILGHSLGGSIAMHLALNYPESVEKIIVEDMRPNGIYPPAFEEVQLYARLLKELEPFIPQGISERESKGKFSQLLREQFLKMNITFQLEDLSFIPIKCSEGKCSLRVNTVILDAVLRDITNLLNENSGSFYGPVLFIYGDKSPYKVKEDEDNIKKLFPNYTLVPVEEADHFVQNSEKFLTEVVQFINS